MKLYLAVGHGHRDDGTFDPGAVGGGWTEQTAGDHIVAEAAKRLRAWGVTVKDEAHTDDPNFEGTVRDANAWGADYVVAIHHDWTGAPSGAFGHWISSAGKALADDIQKAVGAAEFPLRPSWHKRRTDLYILKHTDAPCVLYEVGRIGDLNAPAEMRAMGAAIAQGIADHLVILAATPRPVEEPMTPAQEDKLDAVLQMQKDTYNQLNEIRNDFTKYHFGPLRRGVRALLKDAGIEVEEGP